MSLLISLFIYVFYRTEKTLVNQLIITLFSYQGYIDLKTNVASALPLKDFLIYSLPEGLWVFCITVMSGPFFLKIRKYRFNLVFAPLLISLLMEIFQLLHFTNGRFDWIDIIFASAFWLLAYFWTKRSCKQKLFQSFDARTICCIFCYSIVYLAHVFY
jgi:hypothetical protein